MRAVVTEDYGSAPKLTEIPTPVAGPGEVRVRVIGSSLNGFDVGLAGGFFKGMMEHRFPVVLGRDFAGTVDQVGDGVSEVTLGDNVFGVVLTQPLHAGAFGEYLVVPVGENLAAMPAGLDHATAGVTGLAGAAAVGSLDAINPGAGDTVLVSGATGGVGAFALQLGRLRGATMIATAAPGAETDHARSLGASHVVDRTRDVAAQVRAIAPGGVDAALHYAGDPLALADLVTGGGRFASLLMVGAEQLGGRPISATAVIASPGRALLERLAGQLVAGQLRVPVQASYDLADVPRAFDDFAAGTIGKLAVRVG
jgi:NADPH:quinone reductase